MEQPVPDLTGVRVIVADDDPDERDAVIETLERAGAAVTSVEAVADAPDVVRVGTCDVVVTDVDASENEEDLFELVRAIDDVGIPAVAIVRSEQDRGEETFGPAFAEYLPAPIQPEPLCLAVARLVGREEAS
jgi:DNA-binding NtrC family response regulator